jgi:hypothetical protein
MDGAGVKHNKEIHLHLKKKHHAKFLKKEGFHLSHADLSNTEYPDKVILSNVNPSFHRRYRHALKHKKGFKIQKGDYEKIGSGTPPEAVVEEIKEIIPKKKRQYKKKPKDTEFITGEGVSASKKYIHMPNGQLLKGVQIEYGGGYELPLSTDVHTFSTKKRITK